ncbi:MAG TPA: hypothetical protein VH325_17650 [Bryobacteraceae bacterium]|jgi:ABC-type phosphate transport system substrate-binding protein|nr:hypothetical protein [Bryobacteraceae bacterium]
MNRTKFILACGIFSLAALSLSWATAGADDIAIVVNKTNAVPALSANDLKAIYLGQKERWPTGKPMVPVALGNGHPELHSFLKAICNMSEGDYKKYFLQISFTGKAVTLPRMVESARDVKTLVAGTPGAIGFLRASDVDASVDVVKVNGSAPGEPGYALAVKP